MPSSDLTTLSALQRKLVWLSGMYLILKEIGWLENHNFAELRTDDYKILRTLIQALRAFRRPFSQAKRHSVIEGLYVPEVRTFFNLPSPRRSSIIVVLSLLFLDLSALFL